MAGFARGLDAEDRIRTKLGAYGCVLQHNEKLNHRHKLDFVLTQFPDTQKFFSIGVQVTSKVDAPDKLQEFLDNNSDDKRVSERAVYVELGVGLDLEDGGALAVFNVLTSLAFDKAYTEKKVIGVRISKDLTYEFFDIRAKIGDQLKLIAAANQPKPVTVVPAPTPGNGKAVITPQTVALLNSTLRGEKLPVNEMSGYIHAYSRGRGMGFITGQDGQTYFMHRNNVTDDALNERLNAVAYADKPMPCDIPIRFTNLGRVSDGKYDAAGNLRLDVA